MADGLSFENIGLYLELIEINVNEIIYVIGFRKVESIPKSRKLKPKFKSYLKKQHMSSISWIDMSERKFWKFIGMTITSGWYID